MKRDEPPPSLLNLTPTHFKQDLLYKSFLIIIFPVRITLAWLVGSGDSVGGNNIIIHTTIKQTIIMMIVMPSIPSIYYLILTRKLAKTALRTSSDQPRTRSGEGDPSHPMNYNENRTPFFHWLLSWIGIVGLLLLALLQRICRSQSIFQIWTKTVK